MKRSLICTCLMLVTILQLRAQEKESAQKPFHLFLIGNSFSQNASRYLQPLSKEGGHDLVMGRAELGGCSLQRHWDSVAANLLDSSRGKAYNGKSLRQLLQRGTWDVITLQQYSLLSGDVDTYSPYAQKLYDFIKQLQPGARIVLHQTWAYRSDAKAFGRIKGLVTAKNQQEMWEKSRAAYHTVANKLGVQIIPSGDAFWAVSQSKIWAFKRDPGYDYTEPIYPELPKEANSIHMGYSWNKDHTIKFDPNHANEAGCYLGGLVWYSYLFNENPQSLKFKPASVSNEFAAFLKQTAWNTVRENSNGLHTNQGK